MLSCLRDVVRNAELIESHRGSGNHAGREPGNLVNTHVLVSAFKDGKFFVPVKLLVKEFTGQDNVAAYSIAEHLAVFLKKQRFCLRATMLPLFLFRHIRLPSM